ncbi:hypothetical protein PoB_006781000 [Plakobranchus ocellatus]|uniref:Uncharacterized protein n=1 Tax=Plakobranchus ocellatus TaxID=259542 RepID=A0AAV4DB35_9GAST|nr:hypothetical protein PoB_006781000 [Plakobranchus ocellatus]
MTISSQTAISVVQKCVRPSIINYNPNSMTDSDSFHGTYNSLIQQREVGGHHERRGSEYIQRDLKFRAATTHQVRFVKREMPVTNPLPRNRLALFSTNSHGLSTKRALVSRRVIWHSSLDCT